MKKICVIGVGYLGQHHARILKETEGIELYGVVDSDLKRAKEIGSLYNCKVFKDYEEALDYVDAISIVTPTITHYEIARTALLKGKDVFVEKPITHILEEAEELVRIARDKDRILQVGHLERYNPAYKKAKDEINRWRSNGLPHLIIGERLSPFSGRGIDVDITFDLMIHDLDIVVDMLRGQRLKSFRSTGQRVVTKRIDFATCWLNFDDTNVILTASRVSKDKKRTITVFCDGYGMVIDFMNQTLQRFRPLDKGIIYEEIPVDKREPLRDELRDFADCINLRRCPLVPGEDVIYPLSLVIKITEQILEQLGDDGRAGILSVGGESNS